MKSGGLGKITQIIKSDKDILWVAPKGEPLPSFDQELQSRIRLVDSQDHKFWEKYKAKVFVFSIGDADQLRLLNSLDEGAGQLVIILNSKWADDLTGALSRALGGRRVFRLLRWPVDQEEIGAILEEARRLATGEVGLRPKIQNNVDSTAQLELVGNEKSLQVSSKFRGTVGFRKEVENETQNMRALLRFVKDVAGVASVETFLRLLKNEVKPFQHVKDPILGFANKRNELRMIYFQGATVLDRPAEGVWPQSTRLRINDVKDSQYLANTFGRPFARLLTIPLSLRRESREDSAKVPAVIFFEHDLAEGELASFLEFVDERMQPLSVALDRLLLEQDLKDASKLWERTFDGIQDPVAIFDLDGHILRANRSFSENFAEVAVGDLLGDTVRAADRVYEVNTYPICLGKEDRPSHQINHYVDKTHSQRLQKQIVQNEKMAAIGHLAGNIAHELNNPLTGIRSLAQVLLGQLKAGTTVHSDLSEVEKATERCQLIIQNLLDFSAGGVDEKQQICSYNEIIQRTLPLLKTAMSHFQIHTDFCDKDTVFVEPHLMQQVVFNIVKNACQANGDGGSIEIATERMWDTETKQDFVVLRVKDSGSGIPSEILEQIFDFFFTTKSQGQGTGIGLSLSKSIVDRFGGRITVTSEIGQGSEFRIWLPAHKESDIEGSAHR